MPSNSPTPRHRAVRPSRISAGGMLVSAGAIAAGTLVAVAAAGGSYALWTDDIGVAPATITSGSLGITIDGGSTATLPSLTGKRLLPGDVVTQEVVVANTGTAAATVGVVTAATSGTLGELVIEVKPGACAVAGAFIATAPAIGQVGTWNPGTASPLCIRMTLPSSAANTVQADDFAFTVTFTAEQVS